MIIILKQRVHMKTKRVLSILNAVKNSILEFFLNDETISKLIKKYRPQRLVGEIEYYYHETIK